MPEIGCNFCYKGSIDWFAQMSYLGGLHRTDRIHKWQFEICDSCRTLLRNVIGPVLHRLSHADVVEALQAKMDELNITYDDLMDTSFLEPKLSIGAVKEITDGKDTGRD